MAKHSLRATFRYKFDNFISKGGSSIFMSLVIVSLLSLVAISLVRGLLLLVQPDGGYQMEGFLRHVYIVFLQMTDPGNMNQDVMSTPLFKLPAIIAGLSGVVLLSVLIAFITTALDQKLAELRKGHSDVLEEGHTVILGWNNERVLEILRELVIANESEDDACVVILSEREKEEMDDYLNLHLTERQSTRVITRSGKVSAPLNLDKIGISRCKSVIVLATCTEGAPEDEKASSDAKVIKTVLAVLATRFEDVELNIVAEIYQERNRKIVQDMAPDEVTTVDTADILAKILVQTSRSIGLSVVYSEILSFDGCEMYFYGADWGTAEFGAIQFHFPDGVPMGIRKSDGTIRVNPPADTKLDADDEILIVAEDDSTIEYQPEPVTRPTELSYQYTEATQRIERELILGWHPKVDIILREYADYLLEGSSVDVMVRDVSPEIRQHVADCQQRMPNINIKLIKDDPMRTKSLLAAEPFKYDNIIILSQSGSDTDPERTDSETIIILLMLRSIFQDHSEEAASTKLITEILDSENQELVSRAGVNDFIISTQMVSMLLAQISEARDIKRVYDDLFEEDGSEIYLKPLSLYMPAEALPVTARFADLMQLAQKRSEICLGVKLKRFERELSSNFGVTLNPAKDEKFQLGAEDCLVVLAEDET